MWLTAPNRIGIAAWQSADSSWRIEARGGRQGIQLFVGDESLSLVASNDRPLPLLDEHFVRGRELHLSFSQGGDDCDFGFRLVIRPAEFGTFRIDANRAVFEMIVSIQTSLLDSHPTLDLLAPAENGVIVRDVAGTGNAVHHAGRDRAAVAVVLGPHDAPFTSSIDQPGSLRLRLFGEFLEKGVIRRARPWVIVDRSQGKIDDEWVKSAWNALHESPLPLS